MSVFRKGDTAVSRRVVLPKVSADVSFNVPAGAHITKVYFRRVSAGDTTGGIRIGTAAAGAQVVAATALATQNLPHVATVVAAGAAPTLAEKTLYISTATAWNGAQVDVVVCYDELLESIQVIADQQNPSAY